MKNLIVCMIAAFSLVSTTAQAWEKPTSPAHQDNEANKNTPPIQSPNYTRYPTLSRPAEIGAQAGVASVVAVYPAFIMGIFIPGWTASYSSQKEQQRTYAQTPSLVALTTFAVTALPVYATGRLNGSNSSIVSTLTGGLIGAGLGAGLGTLLYYGSGKNEGTLTLSVPASVILPITGSIIGYQLKSSWNNDDGLPDTQKTTKSFMIMPTQHDQNPGFGLTF